MAKPKCEICGKEICNHGSTEQQTKLTNKEVKEFANALKNAKKPVDYSSTVNQP